MDARVKLLIARQMFEALVNQSPDHLSVGTAVRVTGVRFFDITHLQVGRSRSCIELHPMLAIDRVK
jgi:hypothetical protein